nr:glutamate decarboxylase GadB [Mycolicibacter nonchromogenicus]
MAVTRPQTQPGVVEAFAADLDEAIEYAKKKTAAGESPISAAVYGGVPGGMTDEAAQFIERFMEQILDTQQSLPPL